MFPAADNRDILTLHRTGDEFLRFVSDVSDSSVSGVCIFLAFFFFLLFLSFERVTFGKFNPAP